MFRNKSFSSCERREKEFRLLAQSNEKVAEIQINFLSRKFCRKFIYSPFWLLVACVPSDLRESLKFRAFKIERFWNPFLFQLQLLVESDGVL